MSVYPVVFLCIVLSLCVVKTKAPESMPPTNVETINPVATEIIPAPVRRLWGETPNALSRAKIIASTAMAIMKNWRIPEA